LALSPLNEGLFSILNRDDKSTPSKFLKSESDQKSPGLFRALNENSILDSKSKLNLNSNFKNGIILEKSIFEEENQDVNNFFKFISNNENNFDNANAENAEFGDFDMNFNMPETNARQEEENKLIFNSETKTLLNLEIANLGIGKEGAFANLNKLSKKKINNKYEYDEFIQQNLDNFVSENIKTENIMNKLKDQTREKMTDYSSLFHTKENIFSFPIKESNTEEALIANFSRFDVKDFGFAEENYLKDKITKMLEEEETKSQENFNMFENFDNENQMPEPHVEENEVADFNSHLINFSSNVQSILNKEKKKEINFTKLVKKMENTPNSSQAFYNLLCIAQNEDIKITQKQIFSNSDMIISLI